MDGLTYKSVGFELQDVKARGDDGWSFSGYASTFGNVDLGGDVVLKGAFRESLGQRRPRLLWQHDQSEPIGVVAHMKEDDHGLFGDFLISRTTRGRDAYQLLKDGAIDSMSIGYIPTEVEYDDAAEVRKLRAVDLLEISVVSMPMNEMAVITAVKSAARHVPPHRVIAELKAWISELEASAASDAVPPTKRLGGTSLRLEIARRRLRHAGILERPAS